MPPCDMCATTPARELGLNGFGVIAPGAVADLALKRGTGARGLRSIVEEIMLDMQYELPELENKGKFVINDKVIKGEVKLIDSQLPSADKKSA